MKTLALALAATLAIAACGIEGDPEPLAPGPAEPAGVSVTGKAAVFVSRRWAD